jgi:hypothetical protein
LSQRSRRRGIRAYNAQQIADGAKQGIWIQQNRRGGAMPPNLPQAPSGPGSTLAISAKARRT